MDGGPSKHNRKFVGSSQNNNADVLSMYFAYFIQLAMKKFKDTDPFIKMHEHIKQHYL